MTILYELEILSDSKEEIDRLLEAGFMYPIHNLEWFSPIVVILKKVGTYGKVKIRYAKTSKS